MLDMGTDVLPHTLLAWVQLMFHEQKVVQSTYTEILHTRPYMTEWSEAH